MFMLLIAVMTGSYCGLWFIPMPEGPPDTTDPLLQYVYRMNDTIYLQKYNNTTIDNLDEYRCHWTCAVDKNFNVYLSNSTYINTIYVDDAVTNASCSLFLMDYDDDREGQIICAPKDNCNLMCFEDDDFASVADGIQNRTKRAVNALSNLTDNKVKTELSKEHDKLSNSTDHNVLAVDLSKEKLNAKDVRSKVLSKVYTHTQSTVVLESDENFYMTGTFWTFVVLMCLGTVAFNVANCIGDAVCFDVLGKI